jgi:predicted lipid-binding transport protein (Tim44 family)
MDILFFAAIAFFIFFKLKAQLGKIDEGEKKQIQDKISQKKQLLESLHNQMMSGQNKMKVVNEEQNKIDEKITSSLDPNSKDNFFKAIKACNISSEFFLNGAKSAFEMVVKAFAGADLETLKFLLSEKIYAGFEGSINQRKAASQILVSNLISIEKSEIISASMLGNEALVTIKFVSQQINYVTDKDGQITEGRKDQIAELTDIWTFKKDVTISNPNWTIVSTNSN